MELKDISQISTGWLLARKKTVENKEAIAYKLLSIKSIGRNLDVLHDKLDVFYSNDHIDSLFFTKEGDIIVRNMYPYEIAFIKKEDEGILISTNFIVIRNLKGILPKYLAYLLKIDTVQELLVFKSAGSVSKHINNKILGSLEINVIPPEEQQKVIEYVNNSYEVNNLYEKVIDLEKKRIEYYLTKSQDKGRN
ncbi:restriction endonuclease subunit S [Mycoplasmopsis adleri]|uniref:restriction endonuclease subunit S n=1 Tax=Mycoplasmopsis adleri TaxID=51362 RepID=UPI003872BD18